MANTNDEFEAVKKICLNIFEKKYDDYGTAWRIMRPESLTDQIYIKASRIRSLEEKGVSARVLDMHTIKPLDVDAVKACVEEIGKIVTVEDHNIINGLGSAVCEVAAEMGKGIVKRIGIQDQFGESAPYERLLAKNGITVENIVATAEALQ